MASYTQITLEEAKNILSLYGLKDIVRLTPLSLGISNSNYRVELKDQTVLLKISNDKNAEELREEQKVLQLIKEYQYPFSLKPFITTKDESVYEHGPYYGVLFPFIEGIPPGPSDYTCHEVGRALATLHALNIPSSALHKIRRHEKVGFGAKEIFEYCKKPKCPQDFKEAFAEFFPDRLQAFLDSPFDTGIIHGDLYYDNTLFDQNKLSVVLDFEQAGIGEYILDIGISISGTCLEKGRIIMPLVKSFLEGYESKRTLPAIEKKYINDAIILGLLSISLWRIKRFKEGNLNPLMQDSYRDLILKAKIFKEMTESLG